LPTESQSGDANTDASSKKSEKKKRKETTGSSDSTVQDAKARDSSVSPEDVQTSDDRSNELTRDGDIPDSNGTLGRFRFLLQLRYRHSYIDSNQLNSQESLSHAQIGTVKDQDGYDIQRAFLRYTARPSKYIEAKILLDLAELRHNQPRQSVKLAYLQIYPTKRLEFDVGLLKRTYSLLELLPIAEHELADLGPTDSFIKDQGYGGRDVGAVVRVKPLPERKWMTVSLGAFRGDIDEGYDARPLKLVTMRIEGAVGKHVRIGVNGAYRPYDSVEMQRLTNDAGTKYYSEVTTLKSGRAFGADVMFKSKHLHVRAEGLFGDRTEPNQSGSNHFAAAWIVVAPTFKWGAVRFVPAVKGEILDLNPNVSGGRRTIGTIVFGVIPIEKLRILADVTRTIVDDGLLALSKVPWTKGNNTEYAVEPSTTVGTVQVQYQF
jgi:hypothetical protein